MAAVDGVDVVETGRGTAGEVIVVAVFPFIVCFHACGSSITNNTIVSHLSTSITTHG